MFSAIKTGFNYYAPPGNTDPYWTSVSLLNNWETPQTAFIDGSSNNFSLFLSSVPRPNLRTPFTGSGASIYFNGSSALSNRTGSAQFNYGTGDLTIEFWVYPLSGPVSTYNPAFFTNNMQGDWAVGNVGIRIHHQNAIFQGSPLVQLNFTSAITNNVWTHVAIVRSGNTITAYKNGVANGTVSYTGSLGSNTVWPALACSDGGFSGNTGREFTTGFISNWRIVKGTAVYTGAFTPSTSPLSAISGTSILVTASGQGNQNANSVIDTGPLSFTVTSSGTGLKSSGLSPFGNTYPGSILTQSSPATAMTVATNAAFTYGTGAFTIECWFRLTATSGSNQFIIDQRNSGTTTAIIPTIYINTSNQLVYYVSGAARITGATTLTTGVWYHVAVARTSTSTKMFLNGTQQGSTYSDSNNYAASRVSIGTDGSASFLSSATDAYFSNVRLSKGFCYYTTTFTPSTTPLISEPAYTSLLTCTGTMSLYDLSNNGTQMTQTGTGIVTGVQEKFGTSSGLYSGSNFNIYSDDTGIQFGTGSFTVEGWVYRNAAGVQHGLICKGATNTGWVLFVNSSNQLVWTTTTTVQKTSTTTIPATTWTYFAIVRSGSTNYMFINGTQEGATWSDSTNFNQTNPLYLGNDRSASTSGLNGYLDDVRITKGVARYTASFTAPTSAFPTS